MTRHEKSKLVYVHDDTYVGWDYNLTPNVGGIAINLVTAGHVPACAVMVYIGYNIKSTAIVRSLEFYNTDMVSANLCARAATVVVGVDHYGQFMVPIAADGTVHYRMNVAAGWSTCDIIILGHWKWQ